MDPAGRPVLGWRVIHKATKLLLVGTTPCIGSKIRKAACTFLDFILDLANAIVLRLLIFVEDLIARFTGPGGIIAFESIPFFSDMAPQVHHVAALEDPVQHEQAERPEQHKPDNHGNDVGDGPVGASAESATSAASIVSSTVIHGGA